MTTALLTAELRKITTLRFWWALGITPLVVGLFSSAMSLPMLRAFETELGGDANSAATLVGLFVALALVFLFAAIFGAVNAGAEYRHHTLTTSFLTARGRDGVIGAKLLVTALFGLLYCAAVEVVCIALLMIFAVDEIHFDGTLVAVLGAGLLAAALWALLGAGLALATGSSIVSTVGLVVWYPFGEGIATLILDGIGLGQLSGWLPGTLTVSTVAGVLDTGDESPGLTSWPGAPLGLLLWTVACCGLGWWVTRTRDIT